MPNIQIISGTDSSVLLQKIDAETITRESGVIEVHLNNKAKPKAKVVQLCKSNELSSPLNIGDIVIYDPIGNTEFEYEGQDFIKTKELFIIAKVLN